MSWEDHKSKFKDDEDCFICIWTLVTVFYSLLLASVLLYLHRSLGEPYSILVLVIACLLLPVFIVCFLLLCRVVRDLVFNIMRCVVGMCLLVPSLEVAAAAFGIGYFSLNALGFRADYVVSGMAIVVMLPYVLYFDKEWLERSIDSLCGSWQAVDGKDDGLDGALRSAVDNEILQFYFDMDCGDVHGYCVPFFRPLPIALLVDICVLSISSIRRCCSRSGQHDTISDDWMMFQYADGRSATIGSHAQCEVEGPVLERNDTIGQESRPKVSEGPHVAGDLPSCTAFQKELSQSILFSSTEATNGNSEHLPWRDTAPNRSKWKRLQFSQEFLRRQPGTLTCHYCRRSVRLYDWSESSGQADMATVDHVIPRSQGGSDADDNLVVACYPCNMAKGDS